MASISLSHGAKQARDASIARATTLDWIVAALSLWMVGGIHLDAWAHHRLELESFFTPWHGVLYSGFLALSTVMIGAVVLRRTRAGSWRKAIPTGYALSLLGIGLFALGGLGDMVWHTLFGIEKSVDALVSPPHLLLVFGGGLMITGPLRAAWAREGDQPALGRLLPALTSAALLLALFVFFTSYASPLSEATHMQEVVFGDLIESRQAVGMAGILLYSAALSGLILYLARRWRMPFGSWTFILTLQVLLSVSSHEDWRLIPIGVITGLIVDGWMRRTRAAQTDVASAQSRRSLRGLSFVAPAAFTALYFATLMVTGGIWWPVSLWTGAVVVAGITGWLQSYVSVPSAFPDSH